eukprot:338057-Rhodomonas_salina.1
MCIRDSAGPPSSSSSCLLPPSLVTHALPPSLPPSLSVSLSFSLSVSVSDFLCERRREGRERQDRQYERLYQILASGTPPRSSNGRAVNGTGEGTFYIRLCECPWSWTPAVPHASSVPDIA